MPAARSRLLPPTRLASIILMVLPLATLGCDEPKDPTRITLVNESNSSSTYDLVIDSVQIGAISPFQSKTAEVTPGQHDVKFMFANSGSIACQGEPILDEGEHLTLICDN